MCAGIKPPEPAFRDGHRTRRFRPLSVAGIVPLPSPRRSRSALVAPRPPPLFKTTTITRYYAHASAIIL